MKKLLIISLILCLTTSAFGRFQQKPMLGQQINWAHPLSKGLALHLPLNEGSGNKVFDLSGNGNDGTLTNGALWAVDRYGSAVDFDGDDDFVNIGIIPVNSELQLASSRGFTIIAEIVPDLSGDEYQRIVDKSTGGNATNGYALWFKTNGQLGIQADNDQFQYCSDVGALIASISQQVVAVSTSSTHLLYKNGLLINGSYISGSYGAPPDAAANLRFGSWTHSTGREYRGKISYIYIFNRALSASEIALLYREPFCMFEQEDIAMLEAAIPAPTGGQVIFIQMSAIPLFLIFTLVCFVKGRNGNKTL